MTVLFLSAVLCMPQITVSAEEKGNPEFDEFLYDLFAEIMETDYLSMHYTVRDYESFGIQRPEATLGEIEFDDGEETQEYLDRLHEFDRSTLSASQQHDYDILETDLMLDLESCKYNDYDMLFDPVNGLTDALITNFTEYVFYSRQDVDDYLTMVEEVPDYMEQALEVTRDQASRGHFLTDNALNDVQDGIRKFAEETEANPLIVDFNEDIENLSFLSDREKKEYCERNEKLIRESYIPAYQKVSEELEKLRGSRSVSGGLAQYPDGEAYYRMYVRREASTSKSVEELIELCQSVVYNAILDMVYGHIGESEEVVGMDEAEEVLKYLTEHLDGYPEGANKEFKVSYLDPSITNPNIVAYYLTPCVDTPENNVIRVNGSAVGDSTELFMTLAHEGFPGHQYQITWFLNTEPNPIRSVISHGGYTEGWAMYAETNELAYSGMSRNASEYNRIMTVIGYIAPCVIDLGVNGLNWTMDDVRASLDAMYLNSEIAQDLYDEAVDMPGRLLNYGCGLAQFIDLRTRAEATLGDDFDETEFNRVLLEYGDREFEMVEADLNEWISGSGSEGLIDGSDLPDPHEGEMQQNSLMGYMIAGGLLIAAVLIWFLMRRTKKKKIFGD